ncbi:hypothetical protein LCGC14_1242140 [marine sediment metagenome]|uniref:Uncharacterized protein n=1 Tax=marine sediment metagenome TaxID=412755 RepID=A0A0F9NMN8_9ZZZZ|nr:hypothetical protein [archaeon]
MPDNIISKVVEINNCKKEDLVKAFFKAQFWEAINPAKKMEAKFISPNVLYTKISDEFINIQVEMEGELVLQDKGDQPGGKGRLIELNVRNNKDIRELEGNIRIKALTSSKCKIGIFIKNFKLDSDFFNLIGRRVAELTLRSKITDMLRILERWLRTNSLNELQ